MHKRPGNCKNGWSKPSKNGNASNPPSIGFGTRAVDTNIQLQALNKERLRLPMELQALKVQAYASVHRTERNLKLLMIGAVPLPLCLIACAVFLYHRRRRSAAVVH